MKTVIIIAIAIILILPLLLVPLLIIPTYADINYYTDIKIKLDDIGVIELDNTSVIKLEVKVTNNGKASTDVRGSYFMLLDKNKNQYSPSDYFDFTYGTVSSADCPYSPREKINPNTSKDFKLCYEVTKKEWLDYYIILYNINPDRCGKSSYVSCTYSRILDIPEITLKSSTPPPQKTPSQTTPTQQAPSTKNNYYVYVDELPSWADYAKNSVYDATEAWKTAVPDLKFYDATTKALSNIHVLWVKEFGTERVGSAVNQWFVEVGLGDSLCGENWQPYSANYVTFIMAHEIGHVLGVPHSTDPTSLMYPIALNPEYGVVENEYTLTAGSTLFVPFCTVKDITSYSYHVETDDPTYGFDVYVVPSKDELQNYDDGKPINYYFDEGCFAENYRSYGGNCEGIPKGSGLLIVMGDKVSKTLTKVSVQQQEKSSTKLIEKSVEEKAGVGQGIVDDNQRFVVVKGNCIDPKSITYPHWGGSFEFPDVGFAFYRPESGHITKITIDCNSSSLIFDIIQSRTYMTVSLPKEMPTKHTEVLLDGDRTKFNEKRGYERTLYFTISYGFNTYNAKLVEITNLNFPPSNTMESSQQEFVNKVPSWIKNNAKWYAEGTISESDFAQGIQFMIKEKIINIPDLPPRDSQVTKQKVPDWVKNNAGWWANGLIGEDDFVNGIKYLIEKGIINVN